MIDGRPNPNTPIRLHWAHTHRPGYPRGYFAFVNPHLVLNVHRLREGSPTWEFLVVGFDITKDDHPTILQVGQAGSMKEAKIAAESMIPPKTPRSGQITMFEEEVPF